MSLIYLVVPTRRRCLETSLVFLFDSLPFVLRRSATFIIWSPFGSDATLLLSFRFTSLLQAFASPLLTDLMRPQSPSYRIIQAQIDGGNSAFRALQLASSELGFDNLHPRCTRNVSFLPLICQTQTITSIIAENTKIHSKRAPRIANRITCLDGRLSQMVRLNGPTDRFAQTVGSDYRYSTSLFSKATAPARRVFLGELVQVLTSHKSFLVSQSPNFIFFKLLVINFLILQLLSQYFNIRMQN